LRGLVAVVELLDIDVVSREHLDTRHESRGAEHVPHPGVLERHVEPPVTSPIELHPVGEVEAPVRLDDMGEHREDVAVLAVQLELAFVFVPFDVVVAHVPSGPPAGTPMASTSADASSSSSSSCSCSSSCSAAIASSTLSHFRPTPLN